VAFRLLPRAIADIESIARTIAKENPPAAEAWITSIENKCRLLADNPEMGPARDDIRAGMRIVPAGNYLIFYRVSGHNVDVVRVLHGARDLKNILGGF
jgi:toxin ParE1/3/4